MSGVQGVELGPQGCFAHCCSGVAAFSVCRLLWPSAFAGVHGGRQNFSQIVSTASIAHSSFALVTPWKMI